MLKHLSVEQVEEIARLAASASDAQDGLLNKMTVVDKGDDGAELMERTAGGLDTLDATVGSRPLQALRERIAALPPEGRHELAAILSIGRGDHAAQDWEAALDDARSRPEAEDVNFIAERTSLHDWLTKGLYNLKLR
jgi:hypothetical protein